MAGRKSCKRGVVLRQVGCSTGCQSYRDRWLMLLPRRFKRERAVS
jgi:hypothetical protein